MNFDEADEALTRQARGNEFAMDNKLAVHFYMGVELDRVASESAKRNIYKDVPWVKIYVPGDKNTVIDRIAWLDARHPASDVSRFAQHYERFQKGTDQSKLDGMPLTEWPQITKSQVIELAYHGVKTVEHLANLSDVNLQKLGPGALALCSAAKAYLERASADAGKANLKVELEIRDSEIAELKAQVAAILKAQGLTPPTKEAVGDEPLIQAVTPAPRKRGRPAKTDAVTP